jgi:hypothetical protein
MDVFSKVAQLSEHVGFYALTLQSLDDDSTAFYKSLNLAKKPESPKLFWLTYRHFDGRAADVVVIESRGLLHARLVASRAGADRACGAAQC